MLNEARNGSGPKYLTGLIGRNILSSRSPWLHEQEAKAHGADLTYTLFDFTDRGWDDAELPRLLETLEHEGYAGINVTFPFKQAVIAHLDVLSENARRIGAVNTVAFVDGKRIGHNTDSIGFGESLAADLPGIECHNVLQLGAGGAGSATAYALLDHGVDKLLLAEPDPARRDTLIAKLTADFGADRVAAVDDVHAAVAQVDGLVNATPIGMKSHPGTPLPTEWISPHQWVIDIIYFPIETELLHKAAAQGSRAANGSGMVVGQAAVAFEIFTGMTADRARMRSSFSAFPAPGA